MSQQDQQDHYEKQRRAQHHSRNLQGAEQSESETAQILHELSEIDDLPMDPSDDPVLGQFISKLASTANLSAEEVKSNKWVYEYIRVLHKCQYPTPDGCHGSWRGWAHGDADAAVEPMQPKKDLVDEMLTTSAKKALTRSEDAKVLEEGTRNVTESYVNNGQDDGNGGGGLLSKLGL